MLDKLKLEYAKQQALLQKELRKNPDSAISKKAGRTAGGFFVILGLGFLLANIITWKVSGSLSKLAVAAMITFLFLGPWLLITGKMPKKIR